MIKQWTTICRKLASWKAMAKSTSGLHGINQRQAGRTQARWSGVFYDRQENISKPSLLISKKKKNPLSARGENIASDSMLALPDFCEDAMTPFVGFLKNGLGMKKASWGKLCKLDHQWEQMDCVIPMFPSPPGIYLSQLYPHFVFWFWVKIHLNTTFQNW